MDAQSLSAGRHKLKRNLDKSLGNLRLSKRGRLTLSEKNKIKKAAVGTLQRYLKDELKRTRTKTYDWYFFKNMSQVYHIEAFRNNALQNRYFIVDHEQVPILSSKAFGSTYGQQRIQEFDITSKQIGEIISSSKKLFADMMKITVSEKEDAKIYKAYDTVDEKKIIIVTIALPAALIASAEAVPLMVMASKSSTFSTMISSLGRAFAVNTGRSAAVNGGLEFGGQYFSNGLIHNDWSLNRIDWIDGFSSAAFGKGGDVILGSAMDFSFQDGFQLHTDKKLGENLLLGLGKKQLNKKIGSGFRNTVGQHSTLLSDFLSNTTELNLNVMIDAAKRSSEK